MAESRKGKPQLEKARSLGQGGGGEPTIDFPAGTSREGLHTLLFLLPLCWVRGRTLIPRHPLVPSDVSCASPLKHTAVPADGKSCPSVLSWGHSSRLHSSRWLVFVLNYQQQLYKVTQTVVYPEEIMCNLWPDGIVTDSNGFWTFTYGVTESGFCCPIQFLFNTGRVLKYFFSTLHL